MSGEKPVERRKHRRFEVQNDIPVILRSNDIKVGSVVDLSMGGLGFRYAGIEKPIGESGKLSILPDNDSFYLYKIQCKSVWDCRTGKDLHSFIGMRRCGVRFGELTPDQKARLEYFIEQHTSEGRKQASSRKTSRVNSSFFTNAVPENEQ
jgi:c-di-GMP-binding flagellar brake protein YcgR